MKTKYDIKNVHDDLSQNFNNLEKKHDFPSHFYQSFFKGKREIYQKEFTQIKQFDEKWIRAIESYYPSISTITKRLKSTLKYEEEILPIEKTKKVGPRAIRHLSAHSELIRDVDEDDEVIPSKVLSSQSEIDYGIYENRFIMTLIKRLQQFISERLKIIREEMKGSRDTHLRYETAFDFTDIEYEMTVDVRQVETINKRKANEHNLNVLERAEHLHKLITHLNNSDFMRIMKKYKKVSSPIMKTQIILKNPDFKNAYLLWLFLDKYYVLDYHLDTKTVNKRFNDDYRNSIDQSMFALFSSFFYNDHKDLNGQSEGKAKYRSKKAVNKKKLVEEFEIDPHVYEIEPYISNEYFLDKQEKLFSKVYKEEVSKQKRFTIGLKNALAHQLKISNDLYAKFFDVNQDADVFDKLIQGENPIEALDDAIEKHKIARAIREVKEKDYKESIKLEKKWHRLMRQKEREMIAYEKQNITDKVKDRISKIKDKFSEKKVAKEREFIKHKEISVRKNKDDLNQYTKKIKARIDKEKKKLAQREKDTLKKEEERILKIEEQKLIMQKAKQKRQLDRLRKQLSDKKAKLKKKEMAKKQKLREKAKLDLKKKKDNIKKKSDKKLQMNKDRFEEKKASIQKEMSSIDHKLEN
jgi:hypothetical protein